MKRILRYFRSKQFERDLDDEMQAHLEEKIEELVAEGLPPDEARVQAAQQFGNNTQLREACRERWAFGKLDDMVQDLRYAARVLRKNPVFTAVAVLPLALGIGANTLVFSAVNHVLLTGLPYPQSDRLLAVWSRSASHGAEPMHVSAADFYDWRAQTHAFESLAAHAGWPMNLTNVEEPRRLDAQLVSANLFSTLGVQAQLGRTFLPDEDQEQSPAVIVISHHLWRALGESPEVVNRELTVNGSPAKVVGVMPASFAFPSRETDAWTPLSLSAKNRANREGRWLKVIGRLKASVSSSEAAVEMDVISSRLAAAYPASNAGWSASLISLHRQAAGKAASILWTLQAGASILLLITCANLANLLLARGAARRREIGVRVALGAGRVRIIRQLMVENLVIGVLGCGLALGLAMAGMSMVRAFGEKLIPHADELHLTSAVTVFAIGCAVLTAVMFGLAPALHTARIDLRSGVRGTARNVERTRGMLVAVEAALACMLLVGAGLLGQSLTRLLLTEPGLRSDHLLTLRMTLARSAYPTNTAQNVFFEQVLEHVRNVPSVAEAAEISDTPLKGNNPTFEFALEGVNRGGSDAPVQAGLRVISAGYFGTAGISVLKGRDFTVDDRGGTMPVAIVNESMARRYWHGEVIGRKLRFKDDQRTIIVAGVVPDIKHMGLTNDEGPVVYIPYAQKTQEWLAWTTLLVRTTGAPMDSVAAIRSAIREVDRNQPIAEIGTIDEVLHESTAIPRFTAGAIGAVSGFALLIAVVGLYGLLTYAVAQRVPELGIRLTLGASPFQVAWMLLSQAMARVLAGIAVGLMGAWWLARLLESQLFGVKTHDAATFAGVAVLLVVASILAVVAPARRAIRIDPAAALRAE